LTIRRYFDSLLDRCLSVLRLLASLALRIRGFPFMP